MVKSTKLFILLLLAGFFLLGSCGVLKKNSCGCPPIPTSGPMRN